MRRHIASSRDLSFETQFLSATDGRGMDVVLNALTGEFVEASLRLLPRGGRFLEMGIADARDPATIAAKYPGVSYQAFVLGAEESAPERMAALLKQLMGLFEQGVLEALPYVAYDVRQMPAALRQMAQGRHVGKQVVQLPRRLDAGGTVLITGGAGELGREVARHLVAESRRASSVADVASRDGHAWRVRTGRGAAGAGRADGGGCELRRLGSGCGWCGLERHRAGSSVDGCVPPCGNAGRRDRAGADAASGCSGCCGRSSTAPGTCTS